MQFPNDIDRDGEGARPAGLEPETVQRSRSRVVMWSLLMHGIAIAVLWGVLAGEPEQIEVEEAPVIAIDLVALAQSAPPGPGPLNAPSTAQPAEPQPVAPTPPPVQQPQRPVPRAKTEPRPAPAPTPRADAAPQTPREPAPAPQSTQAPATSPSEATQATQATQQPSGGGGDTAATQLAAKASAVARASYAQLVLARLRRAIVYPRRAQRRDIEGVVTVEMVLAANGTLRNVRLLETSGSSILDEAALKLVRRVAPFPAVPRELSPDGRDIAFKTPIQYRLN